MADLEKHFKELENYIKKRLEKGHLPHHIKQTLLDHGWKEHHILKFLKIEDPDEATGKKEIEVKASVLHETEFDKLYNIIQKKNKISLQEVMNLFNINKKTAEQWASILKKAELIDIAYPPFGDVELRKKKDA